MYKGLARLWTDRRGSITLLAAASMTMLIAAGGLAVDVGAACYESRRLQGVADAAALAAADDLSAADTAAAAAIKASGWDRAIAATTTLGRYSADPARPASQRFQPGAGAPNAAKVTLAEDCPLYLGRIFGLRSVRLQRTATAARIDLAAFSVGSRLAALDGGLANQLLSGLTGSSVSLNIADYNALMSANVDLLAYVPALRTKLGLGAASFEQTLAAHTTLPQSLNTLSVTLANAGNDAAANAVAKLAAVAPNTEMTLSQLADLGALGKQDHSVGRTAIAVNVLDMAETLIELAGGNRQAQLDLSALAPDLASLSVTVAIGARAQNSPWLALADKGDVIVRTAQIRLYLRATAVSSAALRLAGIKTLQLPLYVELASGQARLSELSCSGSNRQVTLAVLPSLGHASIADVDPARLSDMSAAVPEPAAVISDVLGTKIAGSASVDFSGEEWQAVSFDSADINAGVGKTVGSADLAGGVAASLTSKLNLTVTTGGVVIPVSPIVGLARPVLVTAASAIDPPLKSLLSLLGVHLGEADVHINGLRCGTPALVA